LLLLLTPLLVEIVGLALALLLLADLVLLLGLAPLEVAAL